MSHRNRNYKRRVRNLFLEITFIVILVFVATKFIKKDEEKPTVSGLSIEEQQRIIDNELAEKIEKDVQEEKEIKVDYESTEEKITKATLKYDAKIDKTVLKMNVKNISNKTINLERKITLIDYTGRVLEQPYLVVNKFNKNTETRVNIVLDGDLRNTEKIVTLEEF